MPTIGLEHRNIALLAGAQALFQTAAVIIATLSGLVGYQLAPDKTLATLPVGMMIVTAAAALVPASLLMQRIGRKRGFLVGTSLGIAAGLVAALAIGRHDFWLFVGANMLVGAYQGFAQYYRFAAAEAASEHLKSRAISWVMTGGVVAAVMGPSIAKYTYALGPWPYALSYLCVTLLSLLALLLISGLSLPTSTHYASGLARPLSVIIRQRKFLTAVTASAIGSAAMVLVMTATPLAMKLCGHTDATAATVIQWHMLGMFAPSFFTGGWIRRFGALQVMAVGAALFGAHVLIALSGLELLHFLSGLALVGLGWNLLFISGSALLTDCYQPSERNKVQAAHDLTMLLAMSIASFSAGAVLTNWGWQTVNLMVLPLLALVLLMIGLLATQTRTTLVTTPTH